MRMKHVTLCSIGRLVFILFARFIVNKVSFPDFTSSRNWFDLYLLCAWGRVRKRMASAKHADDGGAVFDVEESENEDPAATPLFPAMPSDPVGTDPTPVSLTDNLRK